MKHLILILLVVTSFLLMGCHAFMDGYAYGASQSQGRRTNMTPLSLQQAPTINTYNDPGANVSQYKTFSVFPISVLEQTDMNPILEKQMLFFLRNLVEELGYRFVELNEEPDCLITLSVSAEQKNINIPSQQRSYSQWTPGRTITSQSSTYGTFNHNTFGNFSSYGWGSYSNITSSSTYIPGQWETQSYTQPGYTISRYYPEAQVFLVESKTMELIWYGNGFGSSLTSDVRISSQPVIDHITAKLPRSSGSNLYPNVCRNTGMAWRLYTVDGNNFIPTLIYVSNVSPAKRAGLRFEDMILSVDGVSTVNKTNQEIQDLISGSPNSFARLEIFRTGEKRYITITRTSPDSIKWD